jgi:hypothetical protein
VMNTNKVVDEEGIQVEFFKHGSHALDHCCKSRHRQKFDEGLEFFFWQKLKKVGKKSENHDKH